jgi:hypothetical protein
LLSRSALQKFLLPLCYTAEKASKHSVDWPGTFTFHHQSFPLLCILSTINQRNLLVISMYIDVWNADSFTTWKISPVNV